MLVVATEVHWDAVLDPLQLLLLVCCALSIGWWSARCFGEAGERRRAARERDEARGAEYREWAEEEERTVTPLQQQRETLLVRLSPYGWAAVEGVLGGLMIGTFLTLAIGVIIFGGLALVGVHVK